MNQWNELTDIFGCQGDDGQIPACAADNICIAWPSLLACIAKTFEHPSPGKALDFGCGGGLFCRKLSELGFAVTGYDQAEELIKSARVNAANAITFTSSMATVAAQGRYHLITAIMVLQFIDDVDAVLEKITSLLEPNGLIVYAVFNPPFIEDNGDNAIFTGFGDQKRGFMELKKGVKMAVWNRTAAEYRQIFARFGCQEVYLDLPAFTAEFLGQYKMPFATANPEYLIQGFRRTIPS